MNGAKFGPFSGVFAAAAAEFSKSEEPADEPVRPARVTALFDLSFEPGGVRPAGTEPVLPPSVLPECGARKIGFYVVTLGHETERVLRAAEIRSPARALILRERYAAEIRRLCRAARADLAADPAVRGLFPSRPRVPGCNTDPALLPSVLALTDAARGIGVTVNEYGALFPSQSAAGFLFFGEEPETTRSPCEECVLRAKCLQRKEGPVCGE